MTKCLFAPLLGLALLACGDPETKPPTDTETASPVLWSCENRVEKTCNEYDQYSTTLESVKAREERMARGIADCKKKGNTAHSKSRCPDELRVLVCHLGKYARAMTAHPKWRAMSKKERKAWCPVGRLEDRFAGD